MATMKELDAKALANTLSSKLSKIKAETLANTLGHVDCKALLYTIAYTLVELHVKQSADTLCDVKTLAQVDVFCIHACMQKGRDTFCDTHSDVEVNALLKTLADRPAVVGLVEAD